jgi:agmatine deiminase
MGLDVTRAARTPAGDELAMPAEWAPHARCWMAWPCRQATWPAGGGLEAARGAFAGMARVIARFEPVTMVAPPDEAAEAARCCGPAVSILPLVIDDSWTRDTGPTFVTDGAGGVAGVAWRFNGWGGANPHHERDAELAREILARLGMRRYAAPFVLEGGSVHVDGEGTVLTTEQCLLNPNRNPGLDRAAIEDGLKAYLGARCVIWLGEGLEDDETSGHVDNVACFARPGVVLVLATDDPDDGNYRPLRDGLRRLRAARDTVGRRLEVVEVPQPRRVASGGGRRLTLSYINFYLANGAVIMPAFDDPMDEPARRAVAAAFPDREIVQLPALAIVRGGGGIHCITQQQPAGRPLPERVAEEGGARS